MRKFKVFVRRLGILALMLAWLLLTLSLLWPVLAGLLDQRPVSRAPGAGGANYLIVAPERLAAGAQAWAAYRRARGYAVQVVTLAPQQATVELVRATVQRVYAESGRPYPFFVLLLGHAHSTPHDTYLPAASMPLDLPQEFVDEVGYDFVASDDAYALDADGRTLLPIAFGRVPATSDAEALLVLERTRNYEAHPPSGAGRAQVELVASDSRFGPEFDQAIESLIVYFVETHMPDDYRWHLLYGHPGSPYNYPVEDFPNETARRIDAGALLVAYIGHGSGDYLGPALSASGKRGRVFANQDVPLVTHAGGSIVMMIACSAGEYDQDWSLAERLLLQPGGPVATYAASRITLPAANTILGKDLFHGMLDGPATSAGEWVRLAESNYRNPGSDRALSLWTLSRAIPLVYELAIRGNGNETPALDADTVYGFQQHAYNLFGDPALALARPRADLAVRPAWPWQPGGGRMTFSGTGAPAGAPVAVSLFTSQATILPRAAAAGDLRVQYKHANDKTAAHVTVTAGRDGSFSGELVLPADLPGGHYILAAMSAGAGTTHVGSHAVYLGWPPVGELLASTWFWWGVLSASFAWRLRPLPGRGPRSPMCGAV